MIDPAQAEVHGLPWSLAESSWAGIGRSTGAEKSLLPPLLKD